ncbi:class I SAM-dependent methyltransferase [Taibaiella lutea]|uniref:Class I SAM-dependent methyltransferase n=1 Tax=Taibaiella lutea TaxID=2608001 RepID=A0A5M6CLF2_9BACT|nr:class I SAM-dependent methyltransferase [Taibaiella lutea]KAA5534822.1 class I SAM-dependent methyltransferase [Taibaiella lutea]
MKKSLTNNFDIVAPVYDRLSRLVFGRAQMNAQIHPLKNIPPDSHVLIVGGGTGWILESISRQYNSGLKITYVEISGKMIKLAKTADTGDNLVEFVHAAIEGYQTELKFDAILTPFLFCNFLQGTTALVFNKLHSFLKPKGLWLIADFTVNEGKGKWWKSLLTKSMYLFFKLFGIVEGNALTNMQPVFFAHQYVLKEETFYYRGFIQSAVYIKP